MGDKDGLTDFFTDDAKKHLEWGASLVERNGMTNMGKVNYDDISILTVMNKKIIITPVILQLGQGDAVINLCVRCRGKEEDTQGSQKTQAYCCDEDGH